MRVVDRLARRETTWRELEALLDRIGSRRGARSKTRTEDVVRLGELYRSACTDLMLAEAHDLPTDTVAYLHGLVGRAHNVVYRAGGFKFSDLGRALFSTAPRQLRSDAALRLSAVVFYGTFLVCALLSAGQPDFTRRVLDTQTIEMMEHMYAKPVGEARGEGDLDSASAGFYVMHNTSIGLKCFAGGLLLGLGSLYELVSNGLILGTIFGHMATTPYVVNFYTFVTAHAAFELTAIVFSGGAGLRLGYGLIDTRGETRLGSLRREAKRALPTVGAAVVLFALAAFIEGYISPSLLPYPYKAAIAIGSAALLTAYLALGGRGPRPATNEPGPIIP